MSLFVSHDFKNPQMSLGKPQILPKIGNFAKIIKNHQMLVFVTSVNFMVVRLFLR